MASESPAKNAGDGGGLGPPQALGKLAALNRLSHHLLLVPLPSSSGITTAFDWYHLVHLPNIPIKQLFGRQCPSVVDMKAETRSLHRTPGTCDALQG